MRIDEMNPKHLIADEGKVFKCKCHGAILGSEVYLKEIMQNGLLLADSADNYEEVDAPEEPVREEAQAE